MEMNKELQTLMDIEAIKQLKYNYADICDDFHNPDRICSVFTPDGSWEGGEAFGNGYGHEGIRELFTQFGKNMDFTQHNMFNPMISVNGDTAKGHWYLFGCFRARGGKDMILSGEYFDNYVKVGGIWLYKNLIFKARVWVPREEGWKDSLIKMPFEINKQ